MASTHSFTVAKTAYTKVADGSESVSIVLKSPWAARVHVGASEPSASTADYLPLRDGSCDLNSLGGSDQVWVRADEDASVVSVIRSGS